MGLYISADPWSTIYGLCFSIVETELLVPHILTLQSAVHVSYEGSYLKTEVAV